MVTSFSGIFPISLSACKVPPEAPIPPAKIAVGGFGSLNNFKVSSLAYFSVKSLSRISSGKIFSSASLYAALKPSQRFFVTYISFGPEIKAMRVWP
jgi:hypothetical protein